MIGYLLCIAIIVLGCACIWYNDHKEKKFAEQSLEKGTAFIENVFDGLHIHREYHNNQILTMYDAREMTVDKNRVISHTKGVTYNVKDLIVNEALEASLEAGEERKYQHHLREIHHGHM